MRILTVIYNLHLGGTQRAAQNFTQAYHRAGHSTAVLALHEGGPRASALENEGIPVFLGGSEDAKLGTAVAAARDFDADIIHIHRWGTEDSATTAVLKGLKNERNRILETNVFSRVDRSQDRELIDLHLHLSSWCLWKWQRECSGLFPRPLGTVIPYLVDCDAFFRAPQDRIDLFRSQRGIPRHAFVFGRVGQPSAGKWSPLLIPSFAEVAKHVPEAFLLLVGAPPKVIDQKEAYPDKIRRRIIHCDTLASDAELRACYSSMDAFLHTAHIGESFGMVLAEAMLCQVPVITLSTPRADNSQGEVVQHGKGGVVVLGAHDLPKAMLELAQNPELRARLAAAAPELIRSRYSASVLVPKLERLMEAALSARSREELAQALRSLGAPLEVPKRQVRRLMNDGLGRPKLRDRLFVEFPRIHSVANYAARKLGLTGT